MPFPNKPNLAAEQAKRNAKEYPILAFYYSVQIEDPSNPSSEMSKVSFTEVSGLTQEWQTVDYRDGMDKSTIPRKILGMGKYSNLVLKRGIFLSNTQFYEWVSKRSYNDIERRNVTIKLLNSDGQPIITWAINRAIPIKIDGPTLKSDANEVAVESIELAHEGFTVTYEKQG